METYRQSGFSTRAGGSLEETSILGSVPVGLGDCRFDSTYLVPSRGIAPMGYLWRYYMLMALAHPHHIHVGSVAGKIISRSAGI